MNEGAVVEGGCEAGFEDVVKAFGAGFGRTDERRDIGAALTVYLHGKRVVNVMGGFADPTAFRPWKEDTLVNVWSTTKGLMAVAIARLVEAGLLQYDDCVAKYWPEFAAAGKKDITIADVLSHQAGLNGFRERTTIEDFADWELVTDRLARQEPFWRPRAHTSYHAMTFGFLAGEIARRVTGLSPRNLIREELADIVNADVHIGLPPERAANSARIVGPDAWSISATDDPVAAPASTNPAPRPDWANREDWRGAEVPAANGHATADGVARIYGALANGGHLGDALLLSPAGIAALTEVRSNRDDRMLGPRQWAAGVILNSNGNFGPNPKAFGHTGWGGSLGCADPDAGIGIGFVMNRMEIRRGGDLRTQAICRAVYQCLDRLRK